MKYKEGDRVKIKSLDWYNENKDEYGSVSCPPYEFLAIMCHHCGTIRTISSVDNFAKKYKMTEDGGHFDWTDEMIEGLAEELLDKEMEEHQKICDEVLTIQGIEPIEAEMEEVWHCPEGYIFKDENGNVINATKIVLEKKKKEYPKTFDECCKVLGLLNVDLCFNADYRSFDASKEQWKRLGLMNQFYQLLICRDAYWKIAGEEMGLGKPWEPDYDSGVNKYGIICINGVVQKSNPTTSWERHLNKVLDFPTEEMRDAFKVNFDPDIEFCKELL